MNQGQLPTLLEWMLKWDEQYAKTTLDLGKTSWKALDFMAHLKSYGLSAFDRLPPFTQKFIMQTYCSIYHD